MGIDRKVFARNLILAISLILSTTAHAYEFTVLHTINNIRSDQDDQHSTPIATAEDGTIFFAFVNSSSQILIGKKAPGSSAETTTVTPIRTSLDPYHSVPSVGIDRDGYIHVFGPMHWTDMDYLISNSPGNITSGFTRQVPEDRNMHLGGGRVGGAPTYDGTRDSITYPYVMYDNNFDMWLSYRMRVGNLYEDNVGGTQAGAFGKFNMSTRLWEFLGGNTNPAYAPSGDASPKADAFIWSEHSPENHGSYQFHTAKPFIDKNGRIHHTVKHDRRPAPAGGWAQDILYFSSLMTMA